METVLQIAASVLVVGVIIVCVATFLISLSDFARRDDLSPAQRAGWGVALIVFWPVAGIVYLRSGPGEHCLEALFKRRPS